jgi:hypothetical protein
MTTEINKSFLKLLAVQKQLVGVTADKTNPHFKSKYASLEAVIVEAKSALNDHGLIVTQLVLEEFVHTQIIDSDNGFILLESKYPVISKDHTDPQKFGGGVTYAKRYSLLAILAIPEEDDDGNKSSQKKENPPQVGKHGTPATSQVKNSSLSQTEKTSTTSQTENKPLSSSELSQAQIKRLFAIGKSQNWLPEDIKTLMKNEYSIESTKELSRSQYDHLINTLENHKVGKLERIAEGISTIPTQMQTTTENAVATESPGVTNNIILTSDMMTPPPEYRIATEEHQFRGLNGKMLKEISRESLTIFLTFLELACKEPGVKGLGKMIEQRRKIEKFLSGVVK